MTDLQQILTEIVNNVQAAAADVRAMEAALVERGVIATDDIDTYRAAPLQNAKSALANARYLISRLQF